MSSPQISVLIPCFNSERTIAKTINSLLQQSFGDFNCYIIDNCSTDQTVEIIESLICGDSRFSLDVNSVNKGGPSSFFRLTKLADAELAMFLASDDYLHPDCLLDLYTALIRSPQAACAAPRTLRFKDGMNPYFADGTYPIMQNSGIARIKTYFKKVTDNSRFYGLYRAEALKASNTMMDFFAADLVFTALTLRFGNHVEVSSATGGPLLWRELPISLNKYFSEGAGFGEKMRLIVVPFWQAMACLYQRVGIKDFIQILPMLLMTNFCLGWFTLRSLLASSALLKNFHLAMSGVKDPA